MSVYEFMPEIGQTVRFVGKAAKRYGPTGVVKCVTNMRCRDGRSNPHPIFVQARIEVLYVRNGEDFPLSCTVLAEEIRPQFKKDRVPA